MPKVKMTAASIERLKPPASGQVDYFDTAFPALALRITPKGVRSWVYFGRLRGKQKRATLGRFPTLSLKEARQMAGEVAEAWQGGIDWTAQKKARRTELRDDFATVADEWLKRDQKSNRSYGEVKRLIEKDVKPIWQSRLITDITRRDVNELIDGIVDRGAPTLARRVHAHLHRLFRWAVGRGVIETNPMTDLPKPGAEVKRERVLSDDELALAWKAADEMGQPFGPITQLLILTGARREEITGLRWSEIEGDAIRLAGDRTKTGEPRTIPLAPAAIALLDNLPRIVESDFVFTTTGNTPVSGWSRAKKNLDEKIAELKDGEPIPHWVIHDLRRVLATGMQKLGISLQVIEAVIGHTSGSRAGIVGVYQRHSFDKEKRVALERWAIHVDELVSGKPTKVIAFLGA